MSRQKWFLVGALIILVSSFFFFKKLIENVPTPIKKSTKTFGRLVKTLEIQKKDTIFWVSGYGTVKPKTEITVIPEVSGRVVFCSKNFKRRQI